MFAQDRPSAKIVFKKRAGRRNRGPKTELKQSPNGGQAFAQDRPSAKIIFKERAGRRNRGPNRGDIGPKRIPKGIQKTPQIESNLGSGYPRFSPDLDPICGVFWAQGGGVEKHDFTI